MRLPGKRVHRRSAIPVYSFAFGRTIKRIGVTPVTKVCRKCGVIKPLTEEFFYRARPRKNHSKGGWQSFCRLCWKQINASNKTRRKIDADNQVLDSSKPEQFKISFLQQSPEGIVCIVPKDFVPVSPESASGVLDE